MTSTSQSPDLLAAIVGATLKMIAVRKAAVPSMEMERRAAAVEPRPDALRSALERPDQINVIAECKRRSPSRGVLRAEYDPPAIARAYDHAGASAISVLTEPAFFDGSLEHLAAVRRATSLPILRKDFVVDPYQIFEARAAGADAILLIVAALTPDALRRLHDVATQAGLDVIVEVHDLPEIAVALDAGATIIGVNNRNLRTLTVDTEVSRQAIESIPEDVLAVAESGLKTPEDVRRLHREGYDAFLIGERLMTAGDPGVALERLMKDSAP